MSDNNILEIKVMTEPSYLDWEGKILTTLYLSNCNFQCPFCHNWELIETPEKFDTIPIVEVMRHLRSNHDFLDGVCITGGEPTIYPELPKLIEQVKETGLRVKLDTNGTQLELLNELIEYGLISYIAMDIKAPLDERYNKLAGVKVDMAALKKCIQLIMDSGLDYEFRTTVVPTLLTEDDILDMAKSLAGAKKYVLQQFVPKNARAKALRDIEPYDAKTMNTLRDSAKEYINKVFLRGLK